MRRPRWGAALITIALVGVASAQDEKDKPKPPESEKAAADKPAEKAPPVERKTEDRPLGAAGPETVEAPPRPERERKDFSPLPDRWRIEFPEWERIDKKFKEPGSGEQPYEKGSLVNPYGQNILKGDYPIMGEDI